ncbi:MAG: 3-methylcrotonyl-CoA carboxylase [Kordiimonadales bacterium]|nr:MAG: 3-methylcrotonyl-CoA carboxylase [Kordiimonadales bacterium]
MTEFRKILIASRGEIALRVMRTAQRLGYRTVAVYSDTDAQALHVSAADEAFALGGTTLQESYLVIEKILEAAKATGADAIHPCYGFLSENADFARACADAGVVFIGPSADAIELMGDKARAKDAMLAAGVPCIPGYQGLDQNEDALQREAAAIGYPLMVKAAAGGGGRGIRLVSRPEDFSAALSSARSEAENAFGNGDLILEKAILQPRHIEFQVFADQHGNIIHLGERDCSIQRRHQKIVEEAPSPFLDEHLRAEMGAVAVEAAKACDYQGAGTVEFLVDADKNFYFLEMNTRLQVEHPVTEMITGLDLVEWQLIVAAGGKLPLKQDEVELKGCAVEVRLYAEDPRNGFMPQTGEVLYWNSPEREGVRTDHAVAAGQSVSVYFDPMLAKLIAHGASRAEALRRLSSLIQDTKLLGINNNLCFLRNVLNHEVFRRGGANTGFLEDHFSGDVSLQSVNPGAETLARAALCFYLQGHFEGQRKPSWRSSAAYEAHFKLHDGDASHDVALIGQNGTFTAKFSDSSVSIELAGNEANECTAIIGGVRSAFAVAVDGTELFLDDGTGHYHFRDITHLPAETAKGTGSGLVKAPMDGAIVDIKVAEGDKVEAGQALIIMEAMKMQHSLKAAVSGEVRKLNLEIGQQVKGQQILVVIDLATEEEAS